MTDYCEVSDIEGWFPGVVFSASTKVNVEKVESWIAGDSAYIDSRLNARYETPIVGSNSKKIVKEICEFLVIAKVEHVLRTGLGRHSDEIKPMDYRAIAEKRLDKLESGESELLDATAKNSNDFYNDNVANNRSFVFDKDKTQW